MKNSPYIRLHVLVPRLFRLMLASRFVWAACLLCAACCHALAAGNDYLSLPPQHYLGLSVGGGYAQDIQGKGTTYLAVPDTVLSEPGYGAHIGMQYEVAYRGWFFGIGVSGRFHSLHDSLPDFIDSHSVSEDKNGDTQTVRAYEYVYSNMHTQDRIGMIAIPIYIGRDLGPWAYLKAGATFSIPLYANYRAQADMFTQGIYNWGWGPFPIRSDKNEATDFEESLNYYFPDTYAAAQDYKDLMRIGVDGEVGAYILPDKTGTPSIKTRMRLGVYVSADFRIGQLTRMETVNYTVVNEDPYTRTKDQLHNQLLYNPITHTTLYRTMPPTLEVGIRLTCLFNVSRKQKICRCE
ncbi:MAG: hypothetical protein SOT07_02580 [Paludibacteraceae bacterium]|nr:hypothetical protein [Paludibacteraceae bacterium]